MSVPDTGPRKFASDPGTQLQEQIRMIAGSECHVRLKRERPWASITFSGTRHRIEVVYSGNGCEDKARRLAKDLPETEFDLTGHFVADLLAEVDITAASDPVIRLEILTIVDPVFPGPDRRVRD